MDTFQVDTTSDLIPGYVYQELVDQGIFYGLLSDFVTAVWFDFAKDAELIPCWTA